MPRQGNSSVESLMAKSFVLVTGGSGGIGSEVCRLLPKAGLFPIVGFNLNQASAEVIAIETGGIALHMDMNSEASISNSITELKSVLGVNDSVVGVVLGASPPPDILPFSKLSAYHYTHQFQVNVIGPQILLTALIKNFFSRNKIGTIVGILSKAIGVDNQLPSPGMCSYVVAKMALKGLIAGCAVEYPWVRTATVSPGFTNTKMLQVFDPRYLELAQKKSKFTNPSEVARNIVEKFQ